MRSFLVLLLLLCPALAIAQDSPAAFNAIDVGKYAYELLFTKALRLSLEPIAPTSGLMAGLGYQPKPWRTGSVFKIPVARAAVSVHKYWAVDGSFAWQGVGTHDWRVEPYARFRRMTRLNYFGIGNDSLEVKRSDFAMLERRVGTYGYQRPVGWLAVGGRIEGLWPQTQSGENDDVPNAETTFEPAELPGFRRGSNFIYVGAFVNLNYPYLRSERPRRGGDYAISLGTYRDVSRSDHSFVRVELEGTERFPFFGVDRVLTVHGRLSSSTSRVPFYLMDTLGGADNLRGFKEVLIGGDDVTSTLRPFESFRFRDRTTAFAQLEFRQRVWSQVFVSAFVDAGAVAPTVRQLSGQRIHRGAGIGLSVYRTNVLAIRAEVSLWGGEGHSYYVTTGRGLQF